MEYEESLEPSHLLASLLKTRPTRDVSPERQLPYGRQLHFQSESDAAQACQHLTEALGKGNKEAIHVEPTRDPENGKIGYSMHVPSSLVPSLKRAILASSERGDSASHNRTGFVASLDARSKDGDGLRQMPDDPENPKKSVNNFLAPLGGLERAFDLCERLDYARERHAGNKHKYYASTGSYGLRFDSREDADNAKAIFGAIIHDGAAMEVDEQVVSHKPHFWLKVPGEMAVTILSEAGTLKDMREEIGAKFQAGNIEQATQARDEMLALVTEMGLGGSHVAEQMIREVLSDAQKSVRQ